MDLYLDSMSLDLDLLSNLLAGLPIEDAQQRTQVVETISELYARLNQARARAEQQAAEQYHRPRQPPVIQGDSGKRADQREGGAHRQIDTAGGNDQGHRRRDNQQRGALTDDVEPVGAGEKVAGDQRKHHAAEDEK